MNPLLAKLQPYPFERLRQLTRDINPPGGLRPIGLGIGEPRHATPEIVLAALREHLGGLAHYPATAGDPSLRQACADWVGRRYGVSLDPATQVLPVNGSREALFALAQTVVDPTRPGATVVCPNPFYQIYEGAALLAGAQAFYAPSVAERNFGVDWDQVPEAVWARTQLLYVCSPGNPTGAVMPLDEWRKLFALSDRHGFVIASDECYSEIWFREPPLGSLEAARALGRDGFPRLVAFTSLSKRSNVPGLRSGFVAGDAEVLKAFLLYRTYHGSAMSPTVQQASRAAWGDEAHVEANRALYRRKFEAVTPLLAEVLEVDWPDAGFYLWADVRRVTGDADVHVPSLGTAVSPDVAFARELLAQYNVAVLPGSLLARDGGTSGPAAGSNPGRGRVRLALVAPVDECLEAASRIVDFCRRSSR